MLLEATNQHLNFTPPPFAFLVGGVDFAPFITTLSISRPLADIPAPLTWTGTVELAEPIHYALLPESLDDLENPARWARGMYPVQIYFKGILFATLRILEYYYDEETRTASIQVGDLLTLLNDEAPAEDYKGLNLPACQSVPLQTLVSIGLQKAGFSCIAVSVPGIIAVPPNKPNGSWVQWVQQYLGERGYWLYMRPDECVAAAQYPIVLNAPVLLRKAKMQCEHFQRERSPDIPADKYIVSGSAEKFAKCGLDDGREVTEDYALIKNNGREVRALQRRETRTIIQKATLKPGQQQGFPAPIPERQHFRTVAITKITVDQALGVIFPEKYPGNTAIINTESGTEYKAYDSQGRLRARFFENDRLLGQVLAEVFPNDRTKIVRAETTLEEWKQSLPNTVPAQNDGVIRRKEYTFKTLFAEGTEATEFEGLGGSRLAFGGIYYRQAIQEQIIEQWKGGGSPEGENCTCDRYKYSKRVWQREQEEISATEASPFNTNQMYSEDVPFYRIGALQLRSDLNKDNEDATPPAWETLEPECSTCTITIKGEASFAQASVSPYRKRQVYYSASTLNSSFEAQQLAQILGTLAHQRYRARGIVLPLPDEYLADPTPFRQIHCHRGAYIMDNPTLTLARDGLELAFKGNYVGAIPQVPDPPLVEVWIPDSLPSAYTGCGSPVAIQIELQLQPIRNQSIELGFGVAIELQAIGGDPPYSFSVQGLPLGLWLSSAVIHGFPVAVGSYPVVARVLDVQGAISQQTFTIQVSAPPVIAPEPPIQTILSVVAVHDHQALVSETDPFAPDPIQVIQAKHDHQAIVLRVIPVIHDFQVIHQAALDNPVISQTGADYRVAVNIDVITKNSAINPFNAILDSNGDAILDSSGNPIFDSR